MNISQYNFLKHEWNEIYDIMVDFDKNLYQSPNISIFKLRQLLEIIIKNVLSFENIYIKKELYVIVEILIEREIIPHKFKQIIGEIRNLGNKGVHENYSNLSETAKLFNSVFEFIVWFVTKYGSLNYSLLIDDLGLENKVLFQDYLLKSNFKKDINYTKKFDVKNDLLIDNPYEVEGNKINNHEGRDRGNIFEKDNFESEEEFRERIESYGLINIGIAVLDTSYQDINNDNLLFNVVLNKDLQFPSLKYDVFYLSLKHVDIDFKETPIIKCKLSASLMVENRKVKVDPNRLFIEIESEIIYPVQIIYFDAYEYENSAQFKDRIEAIPFIDVGIVTLVKERYKASENFFPVEINYLKYVKRLHKVKFKGISLNRVEARELYHYSTTYRVLGDFKVVDNIVQIDRLILNYHPEHKVIEITDNNSDDLIASVLKSYAKNKKEAIQLIQTFSINGSVIARHLLYYISYKDWEREFYDENNIEEIEEFEYNQELLTIIEELATQGFSEFQEVLVDYYQYGDESEIDYEKSMYWMEVLAIGGNIEYMVELGDAYYYGDDDQKINVDDVIARKWYLKAAELGNEEAALRLGEIYYQGHGTEIDFDLAIKWFKKAASKGNSDAQYYLGHLFHVGKGVPIDYSRAMKWYLKAADQGHTIAHFNIGNMYEYGNGMLIDYSQALYWYKIAAEKGDIDAQFKLGYFYENGYGVDKDYNKSFYWYKKLAEIQMDSKNKEFVDSLCKLGYFYSVGLGVDENLKEAIKWYELAVMKGHPLAQEQVNVLKERIQNMKEHENSALKKTQNKESQQGIFNRIIKLITNNK